MIAASHIVAGAVTGVLCKRARVAVPAAFAGHFLLDQIPHSCFNMLPEAVQNGPLVVVGMVAGYAVILWAMVLAWRLPTRWTAMAAAIAAFLPDPLSYLHPVNQWFALLPGSSIVPWVHGTFHCDVTGTHVAFGFITQIIVVSAGLYILACNKQELQVK